MRCGRSDHGWGHAAVLAALLPLAALQTPAPSGVNGTCLSENGITFTPPPPPATMSYSTNHSFTMHNLVGRVHKAFAALILPTPSIPRDLPPLDKTGEVAESLVKSTGSLFGLVVLGGLLATAVPVTGLAVLCCRCVCGLCGGRSTEKEKKTDVSMRNTCGCVFTTVTLPLTLLLVYAIICFNHVPAMISSFKTQAKFLQEHAPGILQKPFDDAEVLVYNNSQEFEAAIGGRLDACIQMLGDMVEEAVSNSPLVKFLNATAKHLQAVEAPVSELTKAAEELDAAMAALWTQHIQNAAKELGDAESQCAGCVAIDHKAKMDGFNYARLNVSAAVISLKALRDTLINADFKQGMDKLRQGSSFRAMVQEKADEVKKTLAEFVGVVKDLYGTYATKLREGANTTLAKLSLLENEPPKEVADTLPMYTAGITSVVTVMAIIIAFYLIGSNCSCSGNRTGFCSLRTGSWILSTGVLFFLVTFSVPMFASSVSMALSIAIERYVCFPVENPASAQSREMVAFAHGLLFPKPTKKPPPVVGKGLPSEGTKGQGNASTFEKRRSIDEERDNAEENKIKRETELRRQAHQLTDSGDEGPLGNLDTPDVSLLDWAFSENTLQGTGEEALYMPEFKPAGPTRYVLQKHLTIPELKGSHSVENSTRYDAIKSLRFESLPSVFAGRRRKRNIIHRSGHLNERTGEDGEELEGSDGGTYVLLIPDEESIAVHETHQMVRQNTYAKSVGEDEVAESGSELFAVLKDIAGYKKYQRGLLHRHRTVFGNILFDEGESPALSLSWERTAQWTSTESLPARSARQTRSGIDNAGMEMYQRKNARAALSDLRRNGSQRARLESVPLDLTGDGNFSKGDSPRGNEVILLNRQLKAQQNNVFPGSRRADGGGFKIIRGHRKSRGKAEGHPVKRRKSNRSKASIWEDIHRKELLHSRHYYQETPANATGTGGDASVDKLEAARKLLTLDAVLGILKRFADCDRQRLSAFQLLGDDLSYGLATVFLGADSPWRIIFEEGGAPPKFGAMENLSAAILPPQVPPDLKDQLSGIANASLKPSFLDAIAQNATVANSVLQSIIASRETLKQWLQNPPQPGAAAQQQVTKAVASLDAITPATVQSFEKTVQTVGTSCDAVKKAIMVDQQTSITDFLQTNLNQWDVLSRSLSADVRVINDMLPKVKKALTADLTSFFDHARTQVRERIGDCRMLHLLYRTTVEAVCEEGLTRFGEFWFCVWGYFLFGVPAFLVALSLSTFFARGTATATSRRGSVYGEN